MSDNRKKKNKKHTKAAMLIIGEIYVVRSLHFMTWTCSDQKIGRIVEYWIRLNETNSDVCMYTLINYFIH